MGLVNHLLTLLLPPRVLPKLDFKEGIPDDSPPSSSCPRCSSGRSSAEVLLERLEIHYLANPDPELRFALLTDFADAPHETMPEDEALLRDALERVQALNAALRAATGPDSFFLFHRRRLWNPVQGCWMGWERKRGKLSEFNRLIRGDRDTSYCVSSADPATLPPHPVRDHARRRHPDAARHGQPAGRARSPTRSTSRGSTRSAGGWSRATASCSRGSAST